MKRAVVLVSAIVLAGVWSRTWADARVVVDGKDEVLYLDAFADPKRWSPAESAVAVSAEVKAGDRPTLHMHIDVDHQAGEKAYPIGWPRMNLKLRPPDETAWTEWERFEFQILARMSCDKAPASTANFQFLCPDKARATHHPLRSLELGKWVLVSVPTRQIKDLEAITQVGFNISEANYKHGDRLDFYLGGFRLVRSAEFAIAEMKLAANAVFYGQPSLVLDLQVSGPPAKVSRGLPCVIRQGDKVLRRETLAVKVGGQKMTVDIRELKLDPGRYELVVFEGDAERRRSAEFRVTDTPWEEGR
jgi:hypothetical protein